MRVLVVLAQPPHHEGGAPGRCSVALLRGLLEHGLDVSAVAARPPGLAWLDAADGLPVEVVDVPSPRGGVRGLADALGRPGASLARGVFSARVRALAADADVVHLEQVATARCDEGTDRPSLVHLHSRVRLDRHWPPPWQPAFRSMLELERAERIAIRRHTRLVASSPVVADTLRAAGAGTGVTLAPLGLDPAYYAPAALDGPPVAGLIGTGSWPVTARAMERAVQDVWPLVRARVPAARLVVAGRDLDRVPALRAGAGVEILGEVPSAPAFFQCLSLLLYPLAFGSGVKVKVLEAIASGVPVVTTACGAEGVEAGEGVVVGESDDELADAAIRILDDAAERRQRGAVAREAFLERYTPVQVTAPLVALYRRMASA